MRFVCLKRGSFVATVYSGLAVYYSVVLLFLPTRTQTQVELNEYCSLFLALALHSPAVSPLARVQKRKERERETEGIKKDFLFG